MKPLAFPFRLGLSPGPLFPLVPKGDPGRTPFLKGKSLRLKLSVREIFGQKVDFNEKALFLNGI